MANKNLRHAAIRAGVTEEQAERLMRELSNFTHGMAEAGDVAVPPFSWPTDMEATLRESFPGWEGLTRGEYNGTRAAVIWRGICEYLLADDRHLGWEHKPWPHPVERE